MLPKGGLPLLRALTPALFIFMTLATVLGLGVLMLPLPAVGPLGRHPATFALAALAVTAAWLRRRPRT